MKITVVTILLILSLGLGVYSQMAPNTPFIDPSIQMGPIDRSTVTSLPIGSTKAYVDIILRQRGKLISERPKFNFLLVDYSGHTIAYRDGKMLWCNAGPDDVPPESP